MSTAACCSVSQLHHAAVVTASATSSSAPGVHEETTDHPGDQRKHLNLKVWNGLEDAADQVQPVDGPQGDAITLQCTASGTSAGLVAPPGLREMPGTWAPPTCAHLLVQQPAYHWHSKEGKGHNDVCKVGHLAGVALVLQLQACCACTAQQRIAAGVVTTSRRDAFTPQQALCTQSAHPGKTA